MGVATKAGEAQRDRTLAYMRRYYKRHGYMPTLAEACVELDMPRATLKWHLGALRDQGKVLFDDGRLARSLRLP